MNTEHTIESHYRLIFNVATPSVEEAWLEGYDTCQDEGELETNPYPTTSSEYRHWNDGWWASFYGEEPLFTLSGDINPRAMSDKKAVAHAVKKLSLRKRLFAVACVIFVAIASYAIMDIAT